MKRKILVDIGMTVCLPLLMAYGLIGEAAHEWIGMAMFVLFLLHLFLNKKWLGGVGKGRYSPARIVQTVLNTLIFLCMMGCMVSGILLSRYLFVFLPEHGGEELSEKLHMLCSFWGFVLMCLHLGTHWGMLLAMMRKKWKPSRQLARCLQAVGYLAVPIGISAFLRRNVGDYLFMRSHFVFYDYEESAAFFLLDYLLIMILFVALGHVGMKCLRKKPAARKGTR